MNQSAYFDLGDIWMNELIGSMWLFFFIGLILIWYICIKTNMSYEMPTIFSVIWVGIILSIVGDAILIAWILFVVFVAAIFFYNVSKALKRG